MPQTPFRAVRSVLLLSILLLAGGALVSHVHASQQAPAPERGDARPREAGRGTTAVAQPSPAGNRDVVALDINAEGTRRDLIEVLRKHPPAVARVLKLDPSLMHNESYLSAYPSIRQFIGQHPEIPQNAAYYFEQVYTGDDRGEPPTRRMQMVEATLAGLAAFAASVIVLGTLVWLVRTVLDQRRWTRLSKIQAEVHSKLMDRFSSNDELITYVQTPSGRRFLESGPSPLQEEAPSRIGAPLARILWSVQIGVVLLVGGLGLLYVSAQTFEEMREFFFICGSLAMALGAGFTVSAAASYFLSRKLGLFDRPGTDHA